MKPTLGPPKKFQHLTRAEEVVVTRLRIGHTKATKSHILSWGPPAGCHHCGQTLTIDHMLMECALLEECRGEYYTVDSLNALFETIPETCIVEFLQEAGFVYLIWAMGSKLGLLIVQTIGFHKFEIGPLDTAVLIFWRSLEHSAASYI